MKKEIEKDIMTIDMDLLNHMIDICQKITVGLDNTQEVCGDSTSQKILRGLLYEDAKETEKQLWATYFENNGGDIYD